MIEQKIKRLIEEAMQEIEEAVHRNHPDLDKRKTGSGPEANQVRKNRKELADATRAERRERDKLRNNSGGISGLFKGNQNREITKNVNNRNATMADNTARYMSQMGNKYERFIDKNSHIPRIVKAAKK